MVTSYEEQYIIADTFRLKHQERPLSGEHQSLAIGKRQPALTWELVVLKTAPTK